MRPVEKHPPVDQDYRRYQDALDDLLGQIGQYCSYCEMPIKNAPEVEHVQPIKQAPQLELDWDNFLLACKSCNTIKGHKVVNLPCIAFPHLDNTFRGFAYDRDKISVDATLNANEQAVANRLIDLVKLQRHPEAQNKMNKPTPRDKRYEIRGEAWLKAATALDDLRNRPECNRLKSAIVNLATETGFFSVWMTVFFNYPEMRIRFIEAFPGTAVDCFDRNGSPLRRPTGKM